MLLSATLFLLYSASAMALSAITVRRLKNFEVLLREDRHLLACRVGILFLTVGTLFDNMRTFVGTFEGFDHFNLANEVVSWFCIANHQVLAAFTIYTPLYFVYRVVTGDKTKMCVSLTALFLAVFLFVWSALKFFALMPNPLKEKVACEAIDSPIVTLTATKKMSNSLVCVFAYQFAMIGSGVVMLCKRGCSCGWEMLFLLANLLCLPGQALVTSLGPYYECYGSNFWEQVTFASAVCADLLLNSEEIRTESVSGVHNKLLYEGDEYVQMSDREISEDA